jgi:hypothetical protein
MLADPRTAELLCHLDQKRREARNYKHRLNEVHDEILATQARIRQIQQEMFVSRENQSDVAE